MFKKLWYNFLYSTGQLKRPELVLPNWIGKSEEKGSFITESWSKHPGRLRYSCAYWTQYSENNFWVSAEASYITEDGKFQIVIYRRYDTDLHNVQVCETGIGSVCYNEIEDLTDPKIPEGIRVIIKDFIDDIPYLWEHRYDKYKSIDAGIAERVNQRFGKVS